MTGDEDTMARCPIHGTTLDTWADPWGGGGIWQVCLDCRAEALGERKEETVSDPTNDKDAVREVLELARGTVNFGQVEAAIFALDRLTAETYVTKTGRVLTDEDIQKFAEEDERGYDIDPVEFVGVTIQFSGSIPTPDGISLNAMMDAGEDQCTFTVTSFAATESEARDQLNGFLGALIKAITPQ